MGAMNARTGVPEPMTMRSGVAKPALLRTHLVARVSLIIGVVGTCLALLFAATGWYFIRETEFTRQLSHLDDLLASIEATARVACFTNDATLATEVGRGLMTNQSVAAVSITAGVQTLADFRKPGARGDSAHLVRRTIRSPFDESMVVGEITLTPDESVIYSQATAYSRLFTQGLVLEALAVALLVGLVMLRAVASPITELSRHLHGIDGRPDQHLPLPVGHEDNEIGRLVHAFNHLIDRMAQLLRREHAMHEEIARSERRFRTLAENSTDIIARFGGDGRLIFANPAYGREIGVCVTDCDGSLALADRVWRPTMPRELFNRKLRDIQATGVPERVYWEWETDAGLICHEIQMVAEYDQDGAPIGVLAIGRNVSERVNIERQLRHQATHDALTGLPNRALLKDRLDHALARARREKHGVAVIFIDIDNFKEVNDRFGHDAGDSLLNLLATRMRAALRDGDTVARLGGDEFVIVLESEATTQSLDTVVNKLTEAISHPCEVQGQRVYPTASLGVATWPEDGADGDTLMRNADIAMYVAKDGGRNQCRFFSADMNAQLSEWMEISAGLRLALENREFELHYQPKARLDDGTFGGMEALIRWRHPTRGLVSPALFVPVAERSGLIAEIGDWVLNEACRQTRAWLDAGLHPGRVAVNLSALQCVGGHLTEQVRSALTRHGLAGHHLELEITETILMADAGDSIRAFWELRELGVQVAVDDFGTGYSSLSYLKRLPVNTVKIDKSFIDDIDHDPNDVEIIRAIIAMAHSLGLEVVAEGVETASQIECLRAAGCDLVQGYHYHRPLPSADMTALLGADPRLVIADGTGATYQLALAYRK
jgi:diguanylate cyclase (GGDEF)-like protein/PAS domain S-box-containing protein